MGAKPGKAETAPKTAQSQRRKNNMHDKATWQEAREKSTTKRQRYWGMMMQ